MRENQMDFNSFQFSYRYSTELKQHMLQFQCSLTLHSWSNTRLLK